MTDILPLLQEFYREKLAMLLRHQAAARAIGQYDVNNTYQYVINREEVQLSWLASAIGELGGTPDQPVNADRSVAHAKKDHLNLQVIEEDSRDAQQFADRWTPRVRQMNNARHAKMLNVILGETMEQKRFFDQAAAGRTDLLGKRGEQLGPSHGVVLPTRWIE